MQFLNENGSNVTNATANTTNTTAQAPFALPKDLMVGVTVFAAIIFITALIGNTVVVYIVYSCNHMRNTTNILIANMAIADLWITIDIPYVIKWIFIDDLWFGGGFGQFLCKFCHSAQAGSIACSIFTLVCVSMDRSLAILFPMKTILTTRIVQGLIVIIWLLSLTLIIPVFVASVVFQNPDGFYHCNENGWVDLTTVIPQPTYITAYTLCTYFIPLCIITTMYFLTGLRLWSRKIPGHRSLRVDKRIKSSNKRATIMLITVVVTFALCWFPLQIRELLKMHYSDFDSRIPLRLFILLPWFGFANSAINPILYVVFSENYRREFKRAFTRMSHRRRSSASVSRGMTMRTRASLSTTVPLRKLRNDSYIPNEGSNGLMNEEESSDSLKKNRCDSATRRLVVIAGTPDSDSLLERGESDPPVEDV